MRSLRSKKVIAAVALTALTIAVIGVVLLTLTPIGCEPGNAIGLKSTSNRCPPLVAAKPSPFYSPYPSAKPGWQPNPPPYSPPASEPYNPPTPPPPRPTGTPIPPENGPASAAYPPFFPAATSSGVFTPALPLNCRLPIYVGQNGSGGFIVFPGSTYIADPASGVSLPTPAVTPPPGYPGYGPGYGYGQPYGGMSYVKAFSKWVPVPMSWVSPDGAKYAFPTANSIWVQNVADSAHVLLGEGQQWTVIAFQSEGVYATNPPNSAGLWLLPLSGAPRQIATTGYWQKAAAGAAYGTAVSAVPQGAPNPIIRLDLKTGAITDWFARGNSQMSVAGFDAMGHPVLMIVYNNSSGTTSEYWLTTAPNKGVPMGGASYSQYGSSPVLTGTPAADSRGLWFQAYQPPSTGGMALYVPGSGTYWMSNFSGQVAGGCS
jgi:hypothetical protein